MWGTWVWSLGWEDPLENGQAACSRILAWRIPRTVHGVTKGRTWLSNYSAGNFTESPRINYSGNGFTMCVCVTEPVCRRVAVSTTLWFRKWSIYCNLGDLGWIPGWGRSPGEGPGNLTPVFLPGESHGQSILAGYSPWGRRESDMTERLTLSTKTFVDQPYFNLKSVCIYIYIYICKECNLFYKTQALCCCFVLR